MYYFGLHTMLPSHLRRLVTPQPLVLRLHWYQPDLLGFIRSSVLLPALSHSVSCLYSLPSFLNVFICGVCGGSQRTHWLLSFLCVNSGAWTLFIKLVSEHRNHSSVLSAFLLEKFSRQKKETRHHGEYTRFENRSEKWSWTFILT